MTCLPVMGEPLFAEEQNVNGRPSDQEATGGNDSGSEDRWHPYELALAVSAEDIEFTLRAFGDTPWAEFLLNPRRLRGSDFLMRWSQGRWSEERLVHAVEATGRFYAIPYGPSGTAPDDPREFELYFERLESAGLGGIKRPDLLVFPVDRMPLVDALVTELGGLTELPFTREDDPRMVRLLQAAILAVECENSLWKAKQMPGYGAVLSPMRRLDGKLGLRKGIVLPTVILKEEDRGPLMSWQQQNNVPIHIWHAFYDKAYGLSLDEAGRLVADGLIEPTVQTYQAPGGATSQKVIYKYYHHYAYPLGEAIEEPELIGSFIEDKNGHILPYVRFEGGSLVLTSAALGELEKLAAG